MPKKQKRKYTRKAKLPVFDKVIEAEAAAEAGSPQLQEFERLALNSMDEVKETFFTRGQQYADTYKTCKWHIMRAVINKVVPQLKNVELSHSQCVAIGLAAFSDMKYERMSGGFKRDHLVDSISYESALLTAVDEATFGQH